MKYEDAVAQFTNAIEIEPSNADYYYARGKAYESLEKYSEAKADFEKAIVFAPKNVNAYISLGESMQQDGIILKRRLAYLNRASGLDKRNALNLPRKSNYPYRS